MGRHTFGPFILGTDVVAVINDGLGAVYEVARCLEFLEGWIVCILVGGHIYVGEVIAGDGSTVQCGQGDVVLLAVCRYTMHVLGIDEATANALLHIDEVKLDDTRDESPVLFVEALAGTLLGGQLQIDTRSQGHLVVAVTVVAALFFRVVLFPVVEGLTDSLRSVCLRIGIVCGAHIAIEAHVAGQCAEEVHNTEDAEVVAVLIAVRAYSIASPGNGLVERHLAHAVDGVVGVVNSFWHTVLSPLHHHAAAEDAAEVGTLDGVHQTAGIARAHAVLFPVGWVGYPLACGIGDDKVYTIVLDALEQGEEVVGGNRRGFRPAAGRVA